MAIKKYKVTMMRVTVTVLSVDEKLTPDERFRANFWDYYTLEEVAAHIAHNTAQFGRGSTVEGVGAAGEGTFEIISQMSDWQDFAYPDYDSDDMGVEEIT